MLFRSQSYEVTERSARMKGSRLNFDVSTLYELKTATVFVPEVLGMLKPTGVRASKNENGTVSLRFTCLDPDVLKAHHERGNGNKVRYMCLFTKKGESEGGECALRKERDSSFTFTPRKLESGAAYKVRVKATVRGSESRWSDEVELTDKGTEMCPEKLNGKRRSARRLRGC